MYQSIGLKRLLSLYATLSLAAAGILAWVWQPDQITEYWKPASVGLSVVSTLVLVLGQTPVFRVLCRWPLIRDIAPDISGIWRASFVSNWPEIARMAGISEDDNPPVQATLEIKSRLFFINIKMITDNRYSISKTVCVNAVRDAESSEVVIYYTYKNDTRNPLNSDCSHHIGSAFVDVVGHGNNMVLEGLYWTNRNWNSGRNTAGSIRCVRSPR